MTASADSRHPHHERVEQLIVLTERLTQLIAEQAQAFEARRPQDAARNMEETSKLDNTYRHEAQRMRADPSVLEGLPLAQRMRLVRATEGFDAVIARQGRALAAAKTVTEGLVHASPAKSPPNATRAPVTGRRASRRWPARRHR